MALPRRTFLGLGSLAACGAMLRPHSLWAASSRLFASDEPVLAYVGKYSGNSRVVGASVLSRVHGNAQQTLHVLAEVRNPGDIAAALVKVPFKDVYAQENGLNFVLDGVDVTIENLLPGTFAERMKAMGKPSGLAFAHDALAYNPRTGELSDPAGAQAGVLKILNKDFIGTAALDVTLRGMLEAEQFGLKESKEFTHWKSVVLGGTASAEMAPKYTQSFLRPLAMLAAAAPAASVESLVTSHLVSGALRQTVGIDGAAAVAAFRKARSTAAAQTTDAGLWLAALLGSQMQDNAGENGAAQWFQSGTAFQMMRSRAALAEAQTLVRG